MSRLDHALRAIAGIAFVLMAVWAIWREQPHAQFRTDGLRGVLPWSDGR